MKVAVKDCAPYIVILQARAPLHPSPDQPVKRTRFAGLAESFTTVPRATGTEQLPLHDVMPRGVVMVTVPAPVPDTVTLSRVMRSSAAATSMRGLMSGFLLFTR